MDRTVRIVTALTAIVLGAGSMMASGVRTGCWIDDTGSACNGIPTPIGQCPVEIITDGDCPVTNVAEHGAMNRTSSTQTCTYQKKKKDADGQCTINDGGPVNYTKTCYNATGGVCPP